MDGQNYKLLGQVHINAEQQAQINAKDLEEYQNSMALIQQLDQLTPEQEWFKIRKQEADAYEKKAEEDNNKFNFDFHQKSKDLLLEKNGLQPILNVTSRKIHLQNTEMQFMARLKQQIENSFYESIPCKEYYFNKGAKKQQIPKKAVDGQEYSISMFGTYKDFIYRAINMRDYINLLKGCNSLIRQQLQYVNFIELYQMNNFKNQSNTYLVFGDYFIKTDLNGENAQLNYSIKYQFSVQFNDFGKSVILKPTVQDGMMNYALHAEFELFKPSQEDGKIKAPYADELVFTVQEKLSLLDIIYALRKNQLNGGISRFAIDVQQLELWQSQYFRVSNVLLQQHNQMVKNNSNNSNNGDMIQKKLNKQQY